MLQTLDTILNIRPNERRTVYLMLTQYFFMGAAMLFAQTVSMPLFLEYWSASDIPLTYIGIAIVVSTITAVFLKIGERVTLRRWLWITVFFLAVATLIIRVGLAFSPSKWLAFLLPIWTQTLINLAVLAYWTLAADIFDVRQGKRLFGLLNAGSWLSYVVAGPFAGSIASTLGTANIYIAIAICLFIALFIQNSIAKGLRQPDTPTDDSQPQERPPLSALLKDNYILLIFALAGIWRVAYFVLDAIFYSTAAVQFPDTADNAGFIGGFFSAVGLLGFITDTFLTGRIISRFGLWAGLLTTPLALILSMSGFAGVGIFASTWTMGLFWFAVAGKFNNEGLGFTLDQSAGSILYQPIKDSLRPRARAIGEGIVQPAAIGVAGLLIYLLSNILGFDIVKLSFVYIALAVIWLIISVTLSGRYANVLIEALNKRRIQRAELLNVIEINEQILFRGLNSPFAGTVIYSLDLLEEIKHPLLPSKLVELVKHDSPDVRENVMGGIERVRPVEASPVIEEQLSHEEYENVRRSAVQAYAALHSVDINVIYPYLDASHESDRHGALLGLAKYGGARGLAASEERLHILSKHENPKYRALAAQVIGELKKEKPAAERVQILKRVNGELQMAQQLAPSRNDPLLNALKNLLDDPDPNVQREAFRAAGTLKNEFLLADVMKGIHDPSTRNWSVQALERAGSIAIPLIENTITDEAVSIAARKKLARICGRMNNPRSVQILEKMIDDQNGELREAVLAGLTESSFSVGSADGRIQAQVQREADDAVYLIGALRDVESAQNADMLNESIRIELSHIRERLFHLFGFIHNRSAIMNVKRVIDTNDESKLPFAIETMDTVLPREAKNILLPLMEDLPPAERLSRMGRSTQQLSTDSRIRDLADGRFYWVAMCASAYLKKGTKMHSIVERVLILKSLNLFRQTPDDALAELAEVLTEMEAPAGKMIVQKGDEGKSMFVVVHGRVSIVDNERILNTLGNLEVFGELSMLDTEARSVSVRAEEDTLLFRLDQAQFYELAADKPELAMGTIKMLTGNLRARVKDVIDLQARLETAGIS